MMLLRVLLLHVLLLFTMGAHRVNDVVEGAVAACVSTVYYGCPYSE